MAQKDKNLKQFTGYRMHRTVLPVLARVNEALAAMGLRRTTFSALVIVRDNPGIRQGKLAELLAMEKTNLVQIIDWLEQAGMVERRRSDQDRRVKALYVTPQGKHKCGKALAQISSFEKSFTQGFSRSEIDVLHTMLDRVRKNAESGRICHER